MDSFFKEWSDSILSDSEVSFFIKDLSCDYQELYKISSHHTIVISSYLIRNEEKMEKTGNVKISRDEYKEIWDLLFNIKYNDLKNMYVYSSDKSTSYLFTVRVFFDQKKIVGIGKMNINLEKVYNKMKEITNSKIVG